MSVSMRAAGLRARDVFFALVIILLLGYAICRNARWAAATFQKNLEQPRRTLCVIAARRLEPGMILQADDLQIRVRAKPCDESYSHVAELVGRQVRAQIKAGEVVTAGTLVSLDVLRKPMMFFIPVDGTSAGCIEKGMKVSLVPQAKAWKLRTVPIFSVIDVRPAERADAKTGKRMMRFQLRADHAEDAIRVLSTGDSAKFVPLLFDAVPGTPTPCKPDVGTNLGRRPTKSTKSVFRSKV